MARLSCLVGMLSLAASAGVVSHGLTVEHLESTVGIDAPAPRLSWKLPDGFVRQAAYEIDAGTWKTGRVASPQSVGGMFMPVAGER